MAKRVKCIRFFQAGMTLKYIKVFNIIGVFSINMAAPGRSPAESGTQDPARCPYAWLPQSETPTAGSAFRMVFGPADRFQPSIPGGGGPGRIQNPCTGIVLVKLRSQLRGFPGERSGSHFILGHEENKVHARV